MFSKQKRTSLAPSKTTVCQFYINVYVMIEQIQYGVNAALAFRNTGRILIGLKNEKRKDAIKHQSHALT